jgi:hypothetical protein
MAVNPAVSGGLVKKVFGVLTNIIPYALKKSGLPDDVAEAMGAKGNFWAGVTLGAGAALLAGGMLLGALSGGALLAPGLLGSVLLNGAVAGAAVAAGGFLLRETAKSLGGNLLQKIGSAIFGKIFGRGGSAPQDRYAEHKIVPHTQRHKLRHVPRASAFGAETLRERFSHAKNREMQPAFAYVSPRLDFGFKM